MHPIHFSQKYTLLLHYISSPQKMYLHILPIYSFQPYENLETAGPGHHLQSNQLFIGHYGSDELSWGMSWHKELSCVSGCGLGFGWFSGALKKQQHTSSFPRSNMFFFVKSGVFVKVYHKYKKIALKDVVLKLKSCLPTRVGSRIQGSVFKGMKPTSIGWLENW